MTNLKYCESRAESAVDRDDRDMWMLHVEAHRRSVAATGRECDRVLAAFLSVAEIESLAAELNAGPILTPGDRAALSAGSPDEPSAGSASVPAWIGWLTLACILFLSWINWAW